MSDDKRKGSSLSDKPNTRGTAKWIWGLLGRSEADSSTLTKQPDKIRSRQDSCDDSVSVISGVTTFSCENTAERKAMDDTVRSLEHLVAEALSLANEAGQGRQENTDGGNHPSNTTPENPSDTPNLDDGIQRGLRRDKTDTSLEDRSSKSRHRDSSAHSLDGGISDEATDLPTQYSAGDRRGTRAGGFRGTLRRTQDEKSANGSNPQRKGRAKKPTKHAHGLENVSLRNKSHVSIAEGQHFSLTKSARRQPAIARDWSSARKRVVATVACISTALIGVLIGIYAGLVPSIQYYIADFHHYTILGNVGLYLGMALSNLICWPLPLLHGRKPYTVGSLCIAMPLLFPQAVAISAGRSPYTRTWRVALLLPRALMGFVLGFASMNFHSTLTDLFGASLMSKNPHQEVVDEYDVRRHGGGLGVWLGIWTWCFIGSLSVGFVVGAVVIEYLQPSWGLYISIIIIATVLLLNVLCPEVRRAAWRRSVAEVRVGETTSRRLARGEVMMHRVQTGPKWWGQEVYHGFALTLEMLRQPGFTIMAVYSAWIYAQVVLVIVVSVLSPYCSMRSD